MTNSSDDTVERLLSELCARAQIRWPVDRVRVRSWALSSVERLTLDDRRTAIFKYARAPFTSEDRWLTLASSRGVPVPNLVCSARSDGLLGMLMEDLGEEVRPATAHDGMVAAVAVHRVGEVPGPVRHGTSVLAGLPGRALEHLTALQGRESWRQTDDLRYALQQLEAASEQRAAGAEIEPFGLCHSELHPTSLHIGAKGWRLVDLARAFTGPGLLDIASWPGTVAQVEAAEVRALLEDYVAAGGQPTALTARGGLSAERWALGWHRVWVVEWFLEQALRWITDVDDEHYVRAIRKHLNEAVQSLAV